MFPSSVIRKLARSEEMFAETQNFVGLAADVSGPLDIDALSEAFDLLLQSHPVLGGHLERGTDGRYAIVLDDLEHEGIEVVELNGPDDRPPPLIFDQSATLIHLRVTIGDGKSRAAIYIHHSLADGHHQFSLLEEFFASYTDLVTTGKTRPPSVHPAPDPLEKVLADRGFRRGSDPAWSGCCPPCSPTNYPRPVALLLPSIRFCRNLFPWSNARWA